MMRQDFSAPPWNRQRRQDLVTLILRYIEQNREWIGANHNPLLHLRSGSQFFIWHRELMNGLDRYLQQGHELPTPPPSTVATGPGASYVAATPTPSSTSTSTSTGPPRANRPGMMMQPQPTVAD